MYILGSVLGAFIKRAQRGPVRDEWPVDETVHQPKDADSTESFPGWPSVDDGPWTGEVPAEPAPVAAEPREEPVPSVPATTLQPARFQPEPDKTAPGHMWEDMEFDEQSLPDVEVGSLRPSSAVGGVKRVYAPRLRMTPEALREGIILAEILGPPRALRRTHRLASFWWRQSV